MRTAYLSPKKLDDLRLRAGRYHKGEVLEGLLGAIRPDSPHESGAYAGNLLNRAHIRGVREELADLLEGGSR